MFLSFAFGLCFNAFSRDHAFVPNRVPPHTLPTLGSSRPLASTSVLLYVLVCQKTYQNLGRFPLKVTEIFLACSLNCQALPSFFRCPPLHNLPSPWATLPWPPVPTYLLLGTFPPSLPRSSAGGAVHMLQLASSSLTHSDSMSTCVVCQSPALEADESGFRVGQEELNRMGCGEESSKLL